jgi:hypothetical protein
MSDIFGNFSVQEYVNAVDSRIREIGNRKGLTWVRVEDRILEKRPLYAAYASVKVPRLTPSCGVLAIVLRHLGNEVRPSLYPNVIADATRTFRDALLRVYAVIFCNRISLELQQLLEETFQIGVFERRILEFCVIEDNRTFHLPGIPHPYGKYDVMSLEELRYVFEPDKDNTQ